MAEGRILKKCISESKKLAELKTDSARLLYTWLIPHLDSAGRYLADPEIIKGHIVPKLKTMTVSAIKQILNELADSGLICLYKSGDEIYLEFAKFKEYQKYLDREARSKIPSPEGNTEFRFCQTGSDISRIIQTNSREGNKPATIQTQSKPRLESQTIRFNFDTHEWENITQKDISNWKEAYPACNIEIELAKMREWIRANPIKGRKKNWRRFITSWFSRAQEKGGTKGFDPEKVKRLEAIRKTMGGEE